MIARFAKVIVTALVICSVPFAMASDYRPASTSGGGGSGAVDSVTGGTNLTADQTTGDVTLSLDSTLTGISSVTIDAATVLDGGLLGTSNAALNLRSTASSSPAVNIYTTGATNGVSVDSTGKLSALSGGSIEATTAATLTTARTIGGVSFDGSGNIDLPGVNTAGNQNTSKSGQLSIAATGAGNDITLDSVDDIELNADGSDVVVKDDTVTVLKMTNSSSDAVLQVGTDDKDLIFKQFDGTEVARVDNNGSLTIKNMALPPSSSQEIDATSDSILATAATIFIYLDGSDISIAAGHDTIADGYDGQVIRIFNVDTSNDLTLTLDGMASTGAAVIWDTNLFAPTLGSSEDYCAETCVALFGGVSCLLEGYASVEFTYLSALSYTFNAGGSGTGGWLLTDCLGRRS